MYIAMETLATTHHLYELDAEGIKYRLRRHGYTLTSLGRVLGVTRHAVGLALRQPYPRIERAIADILGLEPAAIWPERYDADGNPNRPMGRPKKSITTATENHKTAVGRNGNGRRGN
jgi:Ner family transcriptional regulator